MPIPILMPYDEVLEDRSLAEKAGRRAGRLCRRLVLAAHGLAERLDWTPPQFGAGRELDTGYGAAVAGEWLRWLRRRMAADPEEAFAWKAGAWMLIALLAGLVAAVSAIG